MNLYLTSNTHTLLFNTFMWLLKATIHDYVIAACAQIPRTVSPCAHNILLVYGRIIGQRSLVGILYSNQSTTHRLHQ